MMQMHACLSFTYSLIFNSIYGFVNSAKTIRSFPTVYNSLYFAMVTLFFYAFLVLSVSVR